VPRSELASAEAPAWDLGYEGPTDAVTVAFKKPKKPVSPWLKQQFNKAQQPARDRRMRKLPDQDDLQSATQHQPQPVDRKIVAAALVILHIEHDRTT
jgi:hypothetical protein